MEKFIVFQRRFVNDDLDAFRLDAFHDTLYSGSAEIIGMALHGQPIDANDTGIFGNNRIGNMIFPRAVGRNNSRNQILRYILIVGQKLLCIFWQAVSTISERRIIIKISDARIKADTINNIFMY